MTTAWSFPPNLLQEPQEARLAYFRALTIGHPTLLQVYEDLRHALQSAAPGSLIFVQGPAGVGKTTLLQRVETALCEELLPRLTADGERLPVVRVEAVAPESGGFNWKDYFKRLLLALAEPPAFVERKVIPASADASARDELNLLTSATAVGTKLRFATEQALRRRRPLAVLVDDAQHLAMMGSGRKLLDQINILKSVANLTRTTHVLTGTYELMTLRHLNGQLSRRSVDLQFPRYAANQAQQQAAFINCLWTFQQHLPLHQTPDLVKQWDYFYERSLGCIGVLKDWLTGALALALENGGTQLTAHDLQRRALTVTQCARMLTEVVEGERKLTESPEAQQELRRQLGLEAVATVPPATDKNAATPVKRRRVGQRKPQRDAIGAAPT